MSAAVARRLPHVVSWLVLALAAWTPASVLACPVCYDPRDGNGGAFLTMTIFMSLLPLAMIGGIVAWLRGASKESRVDR